MLVGLGYYTDYAIMDVLALNILFEHQPVKNLVTLRFCPQLLNQLVANPTFGQLICFPV